MRKYKFFLSISIIIFLTLVLAGKSNAGNEEYIGEMRSNLISLRNSEEPMPELLKTLENELKSGSLSEKDLEEKLHSSKQELENIRRNICFVQPKRLVREIEKTYNPLSLINKLEAALLECELSYESSQINYYAVYEHFKRGFMALAFENHNRYRATANDIYWFRYLRYLNSGVFSSEEFEKFKTVPWDL